MTRRAAANTDGVLALRLEVKQRVEGGNTVDARKRHLSLGRNIAQGFQRKIFIAVFFLSGFKDTQQCPGVSPTAADQLVDENLLCSGKTSRRGSLHRHSPSKFHALLIM